MIAARDQLPPANGEPEVPKGKPGSKTRASLEKLSVKRATHEQLDYARENVGTTQELQTINHRNARIPWEQLEEAKGPQVRFADFEKAGLLKKFGLYLRMMKGSNNAQGAHFRAEKLAKFSDYEKADIIEQYERKDQKKMTAKQKLAGSVLSTQAEY